MHIGDFVIHKRLKACEPWLKALLTKLLPAVTCDLVSLPVWLYSKGRSCSGMVHAQCLPPGRQTEGMDSDAGRFIFCRLVDDIHNRIKRGSGGFDRHQSISNPLASRAGFQAIEKPFGSKLAALPKILFG